MPPLDRVRTWAFGFLAVALPACTPLAPWLCHGDQPAAAQEAAASGWQTLPSVPVARSGICPRCGRPRAAHADGTATACANPAAVQTAAGDPRAGTPPAEIQPIRAEVAVPNLGQEESSAPPPRPGETPEPPVATAPIVVRPDPPLVEALRSYQNRAPEQAEQALRRFDPVNRELLACLLPLAVRLGEKGVQQADPQDVAALVEQVQGLLGPLRERAALEIPKLCFCRPPATPRFGVYELLEENHLFRPGEIMAVYMELRNFACEPRGSDYQTHVSTTVELQDERGKVVYSFNTKRADPSLTPRQDFCHVARFPMPDLPAGAYTLWLKVTDVPTGRTAKRSLDFRVTNVPAREG